LEDQQRGSVDRVTEVKLFNHQQRKCCRARLFRRWKVATLPLDYLAVSH